MEWKSAGAQLLEEAQAARSMGADARLQALFSMVRMVRRLLGDTNRWEAKLRAYGREEEAGRTNVREWIRRRRG